ncbi:hypothetical protein BDZ89DRAFT_1075298 [Hymenopellis radicata]|nr:hypothetical protein BDZ89DRAFT_1075298 [Hymenopellis radicata]
MHSKHSLPKMPSFATLLRTLQRKQHRRRNGIPQPSGDAPRLPSELWILIIRYATLSNPDPLDTTHTVSFLDPPHSMQLRLAAYHASMRQKNYHLPRQPSVAHLGPRVYSGGARRPSRPDLSARPYGRWLRRLHVETTTVLDKCVANTSMPFFSVLENLMFLELNFHASSHSRSFTPPAIVVQPLHLPHLQTLKTSLCSNTFSLLATWTLPALRNLSLLSPDFSYSSPAFTNFFEAHGKNIVQLELGHSSSSILEEHYLTPSAPNVRPDLAKLLPNLSEFICSANAEWNWESPDWIAPHVLLPAHPTLKLIGIRDIVRGDFVLLEQMRSLLRREAFPSLRYVRDMGRGLHGVRREKETDLDTVHFWHQVWSRCRGRGVYLEDWEGVNVTASDWRRLGFEVV